MTWELAASLISVITVGITVGKVIYNLSRTLTKLSCSVDSLNTTLNTLTSENKTEHDEIYGDLECLKSELLSQDKRIMKLEDNR